MPTNVFVIRYNYKINEILKELKCFQVMRYSWYNVLNCNIYISHNLNNFFTRYLYFREAGKYFQNFLVIVKKAGSFEKAVTFGGRLLSRFHGIRSPTIYEISVCKGG